MQLNKLYWTGANGVDQAGSFDEEYKRDIPDRFSEERDDRLMNSLIKNYAVEIKLDGKDTAQYFLTKDGAASVSKEV